MSATYADRINGVETATAIKTPVRVATTANITLSGLQTIDGILLVDGERVLVWQQTNAVDNGIWDASAQGWTRSIDMNGARDVARGTQVYVNDGDESAGLTYIVTTVDPVIGETTIGFASTVVANGAQTILVPTGAVSIQAALNLARNIRVAAGGEILILVEAGHQIATPISQAYADLRHIRIASVDATVLVAAGFDADTNVAQFINCDAPVWDILLDCQGLGRNAIWLENSTMEVKPARGEQNAGASGTLDPRGCGFFVWKGSSLQSTPSTGPLTGIIARGNAWRGIDVTHNSQASIVAADLTDNGTLVNIRYGHAALFVSRASSVQADNATFDGSINGIRAARSQVSTRSASFQNIPGVVVRQFEGGFVNVSDGNMTGSGLAGLNTSVNLEGDSDRTKSIAAQETNATGLAFNTSGTKMFVVGTASAMVHEYTLSTAWNPASATYVDGFSVAAKETAPTGVVFNTAGTKFYIIGTSSDSVHEYTCSAYDVSTAVFSTTNSIAVQDTSPRALQFSADGLKFFMAGGATNSIYEYAAGVAFSIASITFTRSFSLSGFCTAPTGIAFSTDGTRMLVTDNAADEIVEFSIAAYNISAPVWRGSRSVAKTYPADVGDSNPQDLVFSADGQYLFLLGADNDSVFRFECLPTSLLLIEGSSDTRPQGGGQIIAETCTFNNAVSDIARVRGSGGLIVIDNSSGTTIGGRIAIGVNGKINADRCVFTAAAGSTVLEAILASYGMTISAFALSWTGAAGNSYTARAIEDGYVSVAGANLTTATIAHLAVSDAGEIYSDGATFSAGSFPAVLTGPKVAAALRPEGFSAVGDGTANDGVAMAAWGAYGGALALKPGANYRITAKQLMTIPAGAVIEGNGASITLEYTDTSDGLSISAGVGVIIRNVVFRFPNNAGTAHYQERMLGLSTSAKLINCQFIAAVAQPDSDDDIRDGTVRILGEDVVIDGCQFYNVYRCIQSTPDASTARSRVSNTRFDLYGKGVDTGGTMTLGVLENLIFGDASAAALTDPGVNAITEGSVDLTIRNIRVEGTGEHGIYIASTVYVSGLVMTDIQVRGSGQCNIKLRRQTDFILADIHGFDTSLGNAPGSNEDVLHLECCRNGRVIGVSGGEVTANGGYEGIYIDACSDIDFVDVLLRGTSADFVYITDVNGPAEASPPTLGNLRFWGVRCFAPGAVPLLNIQATGAVGPIHLDGVDYRNATGSAVVTNIGGAATDIVVRGNISTSGTMHTNTAGGGSVIIEAFWDRYIGGSLQRSYVDGSFTMYSGQFDLTNGDNLAHFVRSTGTEASGAYIGGYGGSRLNSGRPGWAMVGKQGTADADQVGVAVLVHNSSTSNDTLIEAVEITYQGDVKALRAMKTQAVAVASLPSAVTLGAGGRSMVTDALSPVFGNAVAAGGAVVVPVYSDGTIWRVG